MVSKNEVKTPLKKKGLTKENENSSQIEKPNLRKSILKKHLHGQAMVDDHDKLFGLLR